jgi:hypothetical protein
MKVKKQFQSLPFKCNLRRYNAGSREISDFYAPANASANAPATAADEAATDAADAAAGVRSTDLSLAAADDQSVPDVMVGLYKLSIVDS